MKVKLLKPIYLNTNYLLEGTVVDAELIEGQVIVQYQTCCSTGTRKLDPEEFEIIKDEDRYPGNFNPIEND